jgi:outer membrane protease
MPTINIKLSSYQRRQFNIFVLASNGSFVETYRLQKVDNHWYRNVEVKKETKRDYVVRLQCEDAEYPVTNGTRFPVCN